MLISMGGYYSAGGFSPEVELFAAGEPGFCLIPRPIHRGEQVLWQDLAMTVPVSADGDLVRVMVDISPNGNDAIAPSDAARPVYRTDGVRHWLEGDGVDDTLRVAGYVVGNQSYPQGAMLSAAVEYRGTGTGFNVLGNVAGTDVRFYVITGPGQSGDNMQFGIGSSFEPTGYPFTKGSAIVVGMGWENGSFYGREDGVIVANGTSSWGSATTGISLFTVPGNERPENFFKGRIFGVIMRDAFDISNGEDLAATENYIAKLAGRTI